MTEGVRIVFHKPRLAQLIDEPGGLTAAEAVARAEANLETIKPACRADLLAQLEVCEGAFASLSAAFDDAALSELYAIAVRCIGVGAVCGAPAVDDALGSFCDLIEHLRGAGRCDRDAIGVHVRAWRLLMTPDLPATGRDSILSGLRKVTARSAA
jgi:hypothetical protein